MIRTLRARNKCTRVLRRQKEMPWQATLTYRLFPPFFPFSFPCYVAALLPSATCSTWSYMCIVDISEICGFSKRCELRSTRKTRVEEELSPPRLPAPLSVRLGPRMLCSASSGTGPEINHDEVYCSVYAHWKEKWNGKPISEFQSFLKQINNKKKSNNNNNPRLLKLYNFDLSQRISKHSLGISE